MSMTEIKVSSCVVKVFLYLHCCPYEHGNYKRVNHRMKMIIVVVVFYGYHNVCLIH